jgi:hypothetical protein
MRITAFEIEGVHVVAKCAMRGEKWFAHVGPKKETIYLSELRLRLEADDSSDLSAKARDAVQELDNIVGPVIYTIRKYQNDLAKYVDSLRLEESDGD